MAAHDNHADGQWVNGATEPARPGIYQRRQKDKPRTVGYALFKGGKWSVAVNDMGIITRGEMASRVLSPVQLDPSTEWRGAANPVKRVITMTGGERIKMIKDH